MFLKTILYSSDYVEFSKALLKLPTQEASFKIYPKQLIIVSAESDNDNYIEKAMDVGAVGYFVHKHTVLSLLTVLKNIMLNRAIR
ncbi:hypothetical protein A0O36_01406 [Piscirickettsiaceae bacterium NZ-RLO1]|nr:hypothetical protein A0O36_01406 [Piscirickettsiaceae bacterium NZ-RLO1]